MISILLIWIIVFVHFGGYSDVYIIHKVFEFIFFLIALLILIKNIIKMFNLTFCN